MLYYGYYDHTVCASSHTLIIETMRTYDTQNYVVLNCSARSPSGHDGKVAQDKKNHEQQAPFPVHR